MRKKKDEVIVHNRGIEYLPIGQATENSILNAARYIDTQRALANVRDGCKPSYRRLIWAALQFPKQTMQPSVQIINKMADYHPHSLDSMRFLQATMVESKVFDGEGSFGITSILGDVKEPAAPRYTKTMLSGLYWEILGPLLQCLDRVESPVGPEEITYIPLPFPLCLSIHGLVSGIGYGISTVYPNFSPVSLYKAYIENNPQLLEPNINLFIDKKNSELDKLWKTGKGRVVYSYKLKAYTNEDGKDGFLFEGDTSIFTPNLRKINKYVDAGQVFIDDLTDINGPKMFVGLVNNRGINLKDLEKLCRLCCWDGTVYQLNVTDGSTCFRIPLYDWLDYTYKNYIQLLQQVNQREIEKCKFNILVQEALPIVADYILNKNPKATEKEICTALNLSMEVVENILSKPIGNLRKTKDNTEKIKVLKAKLRELKKFNPVIYTEEIIKRL